MSSLAGSSSSSSSSRTAIFRGQYLQLINDKREPVSELKNACIGGGSFGKVYRVRHTKEMLCCKSHEQSKNETRTRP